MRVVPAIDLRRGSTVRLVRGERGSETRYGSDPEAVAAHWESEGASMLHVVDLDAAFGEPTQRALVVRIVRRVAIPVQVGGGIRTLDDFLRLRDAGAARVVFGTAAAENPEIVARAIEEDRDKVVVGVDVKNGNVAVRGWTEGTPADPIELGRRWAAAGVRSFVYTEVARDGVMSGIDLESTARFARATGANGARGGRVIASGGIGSLDHLRELKAIASIGIEGVIVGRALYEKAFTFAEAREAAEEAGPPGSRAEPARPREVEP
jgi:phosphoribosylformimino-5-aminoimidazole carboxamide ribotide isomerase